MYVWIPAEHTACVHLLLLGCADRDEQIGYGYSFFLLNDKQMSNKVGVEHQTEYFERLIII